MVYPTFTPPGAAGISAGSSASYKPRVRRADFGDGYAQRSGDGLNANPVAFEASFAVISTAEANAIVAFFAGRKGYLPFMWTMPGETTPRQWIATEWRITYTDSHVRDVVASLEENFDP